MSDDIRCEATFDIDATPEEAWRALEEIRVGRADPDRPDEWWFPGFQSRAVEIDRDEGRRLTVRKTEEPCADTIIDITFEHTGSGSTVRVTQSGFDQAFVDLAGESLFTHADHIFRDLHVFLATGAVVDRAWRPWTPLGLRPTTLDLGVRVDRTAAGSWADRVGLREGDLLCTVHGAPVFSSHDVGVVERLPIAGEDVGATWLRGGRPMAATATV